MTRDNHYRRLGNWFGRLAVQRKVAVAAWMGVMVGGTGCTTVKQVGVEAYLIAVRYDVEPLFTAMMPDQAVATIRRDFQNIARLGFGALLLEHLSEEDTGKIVGIAHESNLSVVLTDRRRDRYFFSSPRQRGFQPMTRERQHRIAYIDTGTGGDEAESSPTLSWLNRFHSFLRAGRTDGIVLDRYRRLPGDPPGLADVNAPDAVARSAAMSEIIDRASRWGRLIKGMDAQDTIPARATGMDVDLTVLSNERRRFVMMYNPSPDRFVRRQVALPDQVAGAPVHRAVEVPSTASRPAGEVVTRTSAGVTLPVSLRPGDAALYEIF